MFLCSVICKIVHTIRFYSCFEQNDGLNPSHVHGEKGGRMLHLMSRRSFLLATVGGFALLALPGCESFGWKRRGDLLVCRRCEERVAADRIAEQVSFVTTFGCVIPTGNCAAKLKWRDPDPRPISCSTLRAGTSSKSPISWRIAFRFDSSRYCSDLLRASDRGCRGREVLHSSNRRRPSSQRCPARGVLMVHSCGQSELPA